MTTFPEVLTLPSSLPSILKSASEVMSPLILVFFSIRLGCPPNSVMGLGFLLSENIAFLGFGVKIVLYRIRGSYGPVLFYSWSIKLRNYGLLYDSPYCFL